MFTSHMKYLKGKTECAADTLSWYLILSGGLEESGIDDKVCAAITAGTAAAAKNEIRPGVDLCQVEEETTQDEEYRITEMCGR